MNRERFVSIIFITILLVSVITLTASVTYVVASPSPSASSLYVEEGIDPGASTYIVWREDSTYYAKDENGHIPSWGITANFTALIENIRDSFTENQGGTIKLQRGNYSFSSTLNLVSDTTDHHISLIGEGRGTTRLFYTGSGDAIYIGHTNFPYDIKLMFLTVSGDSTTTNVIHAVNTQGLFIQHIEAANATNGNGILIESTSAKWTQGATLEMVSVGRCKQGIIINGQSGAEVNHVTIRESYLNLATATKNGSVGLNITTATHSQAHHISGLYIQDFEVGIWMDGAINEFFSVHIEAPNGDPVYTGINCTANSGSNMFFGLAFIGLDAGTKIDDNTAGNGQNVFFVSYIYDKTFFALPQLAFDPDTTGWGAQEAGYMWYQTTADEIHYWDGTQIMEVDATPN